MTAALAQHGLDEVLVDLALLFAVCVAVVVFFHRLKLPPIAGFLIAGALMGPNALGLISQPELVEHLAEIGVVLLLFTVGMELSIQDLFQLRRSILIGGGIQLGLTIALGAACALIGGLAWGPAIFLGFLLALSSTATVAKILQDRSELGSTPGRLAMGICVAQDLAVVPMILMLPLLANSDDQSVGAVLTNIGTSLFYLALTVSVAWFVIPRALDLVSKTRSREVFVLSIFTLCLAAATITATIGLSLALGAFFAGLIIGSSGYRHQVSAEVAPFRDALSSLFFVSIGMMFDHRLILAEPVTVAVAFVAVILGKAGVIMIAARALSLPWWVGLRAGLLLAQVGEFSFVVLQAARGSSIEIGSAESVFLVVAVLSIALTPLMIKVGHWLTRSTAKLSSGKSRDTSGRTRDHVVIVGFGPGGQAVAMALKNQDIPFVVIEMNAATVRDFQAQGYPILLGDSSREVMLRAAGLTQARVLVLAVSDSEATRHTADLARRIAPDIRIVARTNYIGEVPALERLGVQEIVPQELETSVEVMVRVLRHFLVPDSEVDRQARDVRRGANLPDRPMRAHDDSARLTEFIPGLRMEIFRVEEDSVLAGRALHDTDLRRLSACTVVAVRRDGTTDISIRPGTVLEVEDVVVLLGPGDRISDAGALFAAQSTRQTTLE